MAYRSRGVGFEFAVSLALLEGVEDAVVLEIAIELIRLEFDHPRGRGNADAVRSRGSGFEIENGGLVHVSPAGLWWMDHLVLGPHHADIQHAVAGDGVLARGKLAVQKRHRHLATRSEKVGLEFQKQAVGDEAAGKKTKSDETQAQGGEFFSWLVIVRLTHPSVQEWRLRENRTPRWHVVPSASTKATGCLAKQGSAQNKVEEHRVAAVKPTPRHDRAARDPIFKPKHRRAG